MVAVSILLFMGYWNNFLGPAIYINSDQWKTLPLALAGFQSVNGTDTPLLMATSVLDHPALPGDLLLRPEADHQRHHLHRQPLIGVLAVPDELVGEEGDALADRSGVDQAEGQGCAGLAEEAVAGPEHEREDHQP